MMASCEKQDTTDDLSESANKFLNARTRMNAMSPGGQNNNFMSVIAQSNFRMGNSAMDGLLVDSSYYEYFYCDTCPDIWDYTSCATITETDNPDGTHTIVYDYGEGCYEYGWLTKGRITYTWSSEDNSYFSRVEYDQYFSYGMTMDGYSEYSYTSDGNSWLEFGGGTEPAGGDGDSAVYSDPVYSFYWSGSASGEDNYTMVFDSGESYSYSSEYSNKWDSISSTVMTGYYHNKSETEGFEYLYEVTEPLVTSYQCTDTWVAVSGVESTEITENGTTISLLIDYGDGNCDNLATVTENGKTYTVDFEEIWQQYYDEAIADGTADSNVGTGMRR